MGETHIGGNAGVLRTRRGHQSTRRPDLKNDVTHTLDPNTTMRVHVKAVSHDRKRPQGTGTRLGSASMTDTRTALTTLEQFEHATPTGASPGAAAAAASAATAGAGPVLEFFDSLPPAPVEYMLGSWHGSGVPTGNPLDGMLEAAGWHGKRYHSTDDAHPLVMEGSRGLYSLNPALVPMTLMARMSSLVTQPPVAAVARRLMPLLSTKRPAARLRMVEYRGVVTGTMIYDALPINDHFRAVDEDTLLGAMDFRGMESPFMFVLRRER